MVIAWNAGAALRRQPLAQAIEIDRPVFLTDRFEHLDGCYPVVAAGYVAIILIADFD